MKKFIALFLGAVFSVAAMAMGTSAAVVEYTLAPADIGKADDNFTFFVSQLPDFSDIQELTEVLPAGTAEAPGGWAGRGTGVVLPGETNHKYFVHRDADTENALTVRFEGGYNKMLAFKAPAAGTYTISFVSHAWGNGENVTLMIFTMDTVEDPIHVSNLTSSSAPFSATAELEEGEYLYVNYTASGSICNYAQIGQIKVTTGEDTPPETTPEQTTTPEETTAPAGTDAPATEKAPADEKTELDPAIIAAIAAAVVVVVVVVVVVAKKKKN